jgi:hypothetical protein
MPFSDNKVIRQRRVRRPYPPEELFVESSNGGPMNRPSFSCLHRGVMIETAQYSYLVAAVIASAWLPTLVANMFHLPRHLLRKEETPEHSRKTERDLY